MATPVDKDAAPADVPEVLRRSLVVGVKEQRGTLRTHDYVVVLQRDAAALRRDVGELRSASTTARWGPGADAEWNADRVDGK